MTLKEHVERIERILREAGYEACHNTPITTWEQMDSFRIPVLVEVPFAGIDNPKNKTDCQKRKSWDICKTGKKKIPKVITIGTIWENNDDSIYFDT